MSKQLLILGGGTASTMIANHLRRRLPVSEWRMTVVDRSNKHLYLPGFLFLAFGKYEESDIIRQTRDFMPLGGLSGSVTRDTTTSSRRSLMKPSPGTTQRSSILALRLRNLPDVWRARRALPSVWHT